MTEKGLQRAENVGSRDEMVKRSADKAFADLEDVEGAVLDADAIAREAAQEAQNEAMSVIVRKKLEGIQKGHMTNENAVVRIEDVLKSRGLSADVTTVIASTSPESRVAKTEAHDLLKMNTETFKLHVLSITIGRPVKSEEMPKFEEAYQERLRGMWRAVKIKNPAQKDAARDEVRSEFILKVREIAGLKTSEKELGTLLVNVRQADKAFTKVAYEQSLADKVVEQDEVLKSIQKQSIVAVSSRIKLTPVEMSKIIEKAIEEKGDEDLKIRWRKYKRAYPTAQLARAAENIAEDNLDIDRDLELPGDPIPEVIQSDARALGADFDGDSVNFGGISRPIRYLQDEDVIVIKDKYAEKGNVRRVKPDELPTVLQEIVVDDYFSRMFMRNKPEESDALTSHIKDRSLSIIAKGLFEGNEEVRLDLYPKQKKLIKNLVFVLTAPAGDSSVVGGGSGVVELKERVRFLRELLQKPEFDKKRLRDLFVDKERRLAGMGWSDFVGELEGK